MTRPFLPHQKESLILPYIYDKPEREKGSTEEEKNIIDKHKFSITKKMRITKSYLKDINNNMYKKALLKL